MSVTDLMLELQQDVEAIKNGSRSLETAREISKGRNHQLKAFSVYLQGARLESRLRDDIGMRMGKLPGPKAVELKRVATK